MDAIRVFVPTFRRASLLARALASLRAQSFGDWIGYVHNDAPDDPAPGRLVASFGDTRLRLIAHERNLGPVATFNRGFQESAGQEPFFAVLEDDNTWDPRFLETLHTALLRHPDASLAWCNQRIWFEGADGVWTDSGASVHPEPADDGSNVPPADAAQRVEWGDYRQATGALTANGAMLLRRNGPETLVTPDIPFTGMEAFRERLLPSPFLFLPHSLATYSRTRTTARAADGHAWGAVQTLLLGSFVRHAAMDAHDRKAFWRHLRSQRPPPTNLALHAAWSCEGCGALLADANPGDWLRYAKTWLGRPAGAWAGVRARARHPDWWAASNDATARRFSESSVRSGRKPAI